MKQILFLCFAIAIILTSCDGRKTKKEFLDQAVVNYNLKYQTSEIANYKSNDTFRMVSDTIFSNNFSVHIENYSLPDHRFLLSQTLNKNSVLISNYRQTHKADIDVIFEGRTIMSTTVSGEKLRFKFTDFLFWEDASLQHAWVNQDLSTDDKIMIDISVANLLYNSYKLFRMSIGKNGQYNINLIDQNNVGV